MMHGLLQRAYHPNANPRHHSECRRHGGPHREGRIERRISDKNLVRVSDCRERLGDFSEEIDRPGRQSPATLRNCRRW
jgi:hypothetical protein